MQRRRKRKIRQLYIRVVFWIILAIALISIIGDVTAKYKSTANSNAQVDLAFYIFKEESISQELKLQSILPRVEPYVYTFSVANYNGEERTQTALEYSIELTTTTNLPLTFAIHKQGETTNLITNITTTQDDDGTYFKNITMQGDELGFRQNQQIIYELEVTFPSNYNEALYKGIMEYIQLTIDSKQKISNS